MSDCDRLWPKFREWAHLMAEADEVRGPGSFSDAYRQVELAIVKSCLLSRTIHGGESPSQTKCPVHQGHWSGIHIGWPGQTWSSGKPIDESQQCREWYDAGCRCYAHKCGCTTGWQPDEHCGCGVKP